MYVPLPETDEAINDEYSSDPNSKQLPLFTKSLSTVREPSDSIISVPPESMVKSSKVTSELMTETVSPLETFEALTSILSNPNSENPEHHCNRDSQLYYNFFYVVEA